MNPREKAILQRLAPLALLMLGCTMRPPTTDEGLPSTAANATPSAPEQASSLAPGTVPGVVSASPRDIRAASPRPSVVLVPPAPADGMPVTLTGANVPAFATIQIWLQDTYDTGSFWKAGPYLPSDEPHDFLKLGEANSDATGHFSFNFTQRTFFPGNHNLPNNAYTIWLVFPPGNVVAPAVISWFSPALVSVSGQLYDDAGAPLSGDASVTLDFPDATPTTKETVTASGGSYHFARIPESGPMRLTVSRPNWPDRVREIAPGVPRDGQPTPSPFATSNTALVFNFGGPATPEDPDAPAYFLSSRLADPSVAYTTIEGDVRDLHGNLVPSSTGAKVIVGAEWLPDTPGAFATTVPVIDGHYQIDHAPTGRRYDFDIRTNLVYPLSGFVERSVLVKPSLTASATIVNFGGPATSEDPYAPLHPFPSPQAPSMAPSPFVPAP